jgi:sporulation protein YlmC with PRC-barrel domain
MKSKYLGAALLGTVLLAGPAFAQNPSTDRSNVNNAVHKEGQWRASKLTGLNVYNDNNEKIGDINELIVDKSAKVDNVIIGVGGFLGLGEHYVAVPMEKLKWVEEPVRTSSTTTAPADRSTVGSSRSERTGTEKWYPDHAVLGGATKEQLKAMPQFRYD